MSRRLPLEDLLANAPEEVREDLAEGLAPP
jgi:hypothetical protein